jgi:uncharacterized protein
MYQTSAARINSGMITTYLLTFVALFYTGLISIVTSFIPPLLHLTSSTFGVLIEVLIMFYTVWMINNARASGDQRKLSFRFALLCTVWGAMLASMFATYTAASIFGAFFSAAFLFLIMSGWAYFSKRNISSIGSYLMVALIALIVVSLVNLFIGSSLLQIGLSVIAILLFLAITAWESQEIRDNLRNANSVEDEVFYITDGAVSFYICFLNIFINILSLIGVPKPPSN